MSTNRGEVEDLELFAWVGQDELEPGNGVGLKQAIVPAGAIPMVAVRKHRDRMDRVKPQMEALARYFGQKIFLVRLKVEAIEDATESGEES